MAITKNDLHEQFADFFQEEAVKPFAYLLSKRLQEGHICVDMREGIYNLGEMPYTFPEKPEQVLKHLKSVSTDAMEPRPFVLHQHKLYFHRYFQYETNILDAIKRMLHNEAQTIHARLASLETIQDLIISLRDNSDISGLSQNEQIDWQLIAALSAVLHDFTIITGGPGTGKTTTVAKVLAMLFAIHPNMRVALAAPTGKAAVRMADSLKETTLDLPDEIRQKFNQLVPGTLHRLLQYVPNTIYFKHDAQHPLPYDVIIVDEASMIDVPMFAKLLQAVPDHARIIMLGDKNQLASVEAGSILGDLCKSHAAVNVFQDATAQLLNKFIEADAKKIQPPFIGNVNHLLREHIIELQRSRRFTSSSGIGKLSKAVIENDETVLSELCDKHNGAEVQVLQEEDPVSFENFVLGYQYFIQEKDIQKALQLLNQYRVLVAVREGDRGLYAINERIELILKKKGWIRPDQDFYENRPVIVTKNFPDLNLYNGDVGIVRADANGQLRVWFEDAQKKIRSVMPGYISGAETVFAMTIHKSQGSEYDHIWVVLPKVADHQLLTRELLYTAITRAKKTVVVQASKELMVHTASISVKRSSGINGRFNA